jgi:hypothetical protein
MAAKQASIDLLADIKAVIDQYPNIKMTVRQVYYRLVAQQKLPNSTSSYNRVKRVLTEARLEGTVSFDSIEDRTRSIISPDGEQEESVGRYTRSWEAHIRNLDEHYDLPRWWGQPSKVVVLVEKQALQGLFMDVCEERAVDLLVCRGYPSLTVLYKLAKSLRRCEEDVQLLYFGDYDPSGLDIDRNVEERLSEDFGATFTFERIAISLDQIEEYDIPPAPAKLTDSRTRGMEEKYGEAMQVELDAIDPPDLQTIIGDAIDAHFDEDIYDNDRADELENRRGRVKEWLDKLIVPRKG